MEPTQVQSKPAVQTLATNPDQFCKKCNVKLLGDNYFCPNCGKKIKEPPFKFSLTNFIGNVLLSILLPPLGIFPGIKHLKNTDKKAKALGILYIILTILISIVMIKFTIDYLSNMNKMLNDIYLQQNLYK